VWGGLTSLERKSIYNPKAYPNQRRRALKDLMVYGITLERIKEAYEHSDHVRSMENGLTNNRENGFTGNSRSRE
jgi:hypothetical protein